MEDKTRAYNNLICKSETKKHLEKLGPDEGIILK
jgi:hypothetical protein